MSLAPDWPDSAEYLCLSSGSVERKRHFVSGAVFLACPFPRLSASASLLFFLLFFLKKKERKKERKSSDAAKDFLSEMCCSGKMSLPQIHRIRLGLSVAAWR